MKAKFVVLGVLIGLALGLAIFGIPASAQSSTPTCVGVGVTNPTEKLEVDGKIKATGLIVAGSGANDGQITATKLAVAGAGADVTLNGTQTYVGCNWNGRQGYHDDGPGNDFALVCKDGRIIMWCIIDDRNYRQGKYDCS
jgi:hypothetical protein